MFYVFRGYKKTLATLGYKVDFQVVFVHEVRLLTLSRRRPLSYIKKSIDMLSKKMDWFLYDRDLRHERVKGLFSKLYLSLF